MVDSDYEKEYMQRKKKLRQLHTKLKDTKEVQEIYHKIMGSMEASNDNSEDEAKSSSK